MFRKPYGFVLSLLAALVTAQPLAELPIRLQQGELSLSVDPHYGGRITEMRLGDRDLLALSDPGANSFGSTFWLSPQSLWNWPPIVEHDTAPYQVQGLGQNFVALESEAGAGARVAKAIALQGENRARIDYRILAEKPFAEVAAWEITRVQKRGIAFAPVAPNTVKTVRGEMDFHLDDDSMLWLPMSASDKLVEGKVVANGREGWLAYAVDRMLYLKVYPPVAQQAVASGEGDIELYLSGELPFLELEVQSAAQPLETGEILQWSVEWLLLPIPAPVEVRQGSQSLVAFVRDQVRRQATLSD
ncbi:hypothetical protein [uncultured Microbulbifer sp.]|uniref:hypothetical protein n=1 Tax=uncultured Microbulbifer sp. TaxID=348147 RepID=UPI0025D1BF8A|nr:hypothetical protein [uncultured Microbulbifer sp.]